MNCLVVASHLLGQQSLSLDELNIGRIACAWNLAKNGMRMQFLMHTILPTWVSFNSSKRKECCPKR